MGRGHGFRVFCESYSVEEPSASLGVPYFLTRGSDDVWERSWRRSSVQAVG